MSISRWGRTGSVTLMVLSACIGGRTRPKQRCAASEWSTPRPLVREGQPPVYVEAPAVVRVRTGTLLVGAPTLEWASQNSIVGPSGIQDKLAGVLVTHDSVIPIPLPPGAPYLLDPAAVSDGHGGAYVVWGTSPAPKRSFGNAITGLAYSHFDGETFSQSRQLLNASRLLWWPGQRDVLQRSGGFEVATSGYNIVGSRSTMGFVTARLINDSAEVTWDNLGALVNFMTMIDSPEFGTMDVLITTLEVIPEVQQYGVFVRKRTGSVLPKPVLASPIRSDSAAQGLTALAAEKAIHVFWIERGRYSSALKATMLHHLSSSDSGRTFKQEQPFMIPAEVIQFETAWLGSEVILALRYATGKIALLTWGRNGWSGLRSLSSVPTISAPKFVSIPGDSLALALGTAKLLSDGVTVEDPQEMISVLRTSCSKKH